MTPPDSLAGEHPGGQREFADIICEPTVQEKRSVATSPRRLSMSFALLVPLLTVTPTMGADPLASDSDYMAQPLDSVKDASAPVDLARYMAQRAPGDPDPRVHMRTLIALAHANRQSALDYCARQRPPIPPLECAGGVPFCALIVDRRTDKVIASGCNHGAANPLFHGEIAAIMDFATRLQGQGIPFRTVAGHHDLYTTGESCAMCMGAVLWSGFHTLFFGSSLQHLNRYFAQIMISDQALSGLWRECQGTENRNRTQVVGGVLAAENDALFAEFGPQFCPTGRSHPGDDHVKP
jgi:tRNA(Arg) A34 adenosine deaminase TadA